MNIYPLAIYTANHGLSWNYPVGEIPFQEIDACRKAFGALPDFDAGAKGFDGVWAKGDRVFVMRCQSVPAWDFKGRSATYLAVTWIPRSEAGTTDFDKLLDSEMMSKPSKTPPLFFKAEATTSRRTSGIPLTPYLADGFTRAGAIIAGMDGTSTIAIKRITGSRQASLTVYSAGKHNALLSEQNRLASVREGKNAHMQSDAPVALMVLFVIWFVTASITIIMWFKWQGEVDTNKTMQKEVESLEREKEELVTQLEIARWYSVLLNGSNNEILRRDVHSSESQKELLRLPVRKCILLPVIWDIPE